MFALKRYIDQGLSHDEADSAALRDAIAYSREMVGSGR